MNRFEKRDYYIQNFAFAIPNIEAIDLKEDILKKIKPKYNLFLCWPPYDTSMGANCLKYFRGKYAFYIGEGQGGCTGNDKFHNILQDEYDLIKEVFIPTFPGIYDSLDLYKRKGE